ncbi:hypothetical protein C5Y93_00275 [Blastopirellula marina]|uniref:VCBS repeat-containing protein n=2 Tax=Blastopirellula marina TaxID=124 RepID=A0A2S8GUS3_9BACT|nr:hypothetical protein C5Y93_00275 [Blastopirellula marina]
MWSLSVVAIAQAGDGWRVHKLSTDDIDYEQVVVGDLNRDGLPDIATVGVRRNEQGVVQVFQHPGKAVAKNAWKRFLDQDVPQPHDVALLDFDGNGWLDVVTSHRDESGPLRWHRLVPNPQNQGRDLAWSTDAVGPEHNVPLGARLAVAQIDGVRGGELVCAGQGNDTTIGWLKRQNVGGAQFYIEGFRPIASIATASAMVIQDVDRDRLADLVFIHPGPKIRGIHWLANPGAHNAALPESWGHAMIGDEDDSVAGLAFGYLGNDQLLDVATATRSGFIRLLTHDSRRPLTWKSSVIPSPYNAKEGTCIAIADLNGDGLVDLIHGGLHRFGEGTLVCFRQQLEGDAIRWVVDPLAVLPRGTFEKVVPYDLDQDGDLDLLILQRDDGIGRLVWYENPS